MKHLTAGLMRGQVKEDGVISLADPDRWDSIALDFLADTTSAISPQELLEVSVTLKFTCEADFAQHPLLKLPWRTEQIKMVVASLILSSYFHVSL